jgi:hypothetical protein
LNKIPGVGKSGTSRTFDLKSVRDGSSAVM